MQVVKDQKKVPREVMDAQFMEVVKARLDQTLNDLAY